MDRNQFDAQLKTLFPANPLHPAVEKAGFTRVGIAYLRAALLKNDAYRPVEPVPTELKASQKEELQQLFREKGHNQRLIVSTRRNLVRVKTLSERADIMKLCKAANDRINEVQRAIDALERGEAVTHSLPEVPKEKAPLEARLLTLGTLISRMKRRIKEGTGDLDNAKTRLSELEAEKIQVQKIKYGKR